jgi:hypothetical protein
MTIMAIFEVIERHHQPVMLAAVRYRSVFCNGLRAA